MTSNSILFIQQPRKFTPPPRTLPKPQTHKTTVNETNRDRQRIWKINSNPYRTVTKGSTKKHKRIPRKSDAGVCWTRMFAVSKNPCLPSCKPLFTPTTITNEYSEVCIVRYVMLNQVKLTMGVVYGGPPASRRQWTRFFDTSEPNVTVRFVAKWTPWCCTGCSICLCLIQYTFKNFLRYKRNLYLENQASFSG